MSAKRDLSADVEILKRLDEHFPADPVTDSFVALSLDGARAAAGLATTDKAGCAASCACACHNLGDDTDPGPHKATCRYADPDFMPPISRVAYVPLAEAMTRDIERAETFEDADLARIGGEDGADV
jgi:hypothetical protein